jgi:hypothetical protein
MTEQFWMGLVAGLVAWGFLVVVFITTRAGSISQAFFGLDVAGRANRDADFATKLSAMLGLPLPTAPAATSAPTPKTSTPAAPPKPTGEPLRLIALLQQEARLIDFLLEDITNAPDQSIGQAVREIHRKAKQVLKEHLVIEVVMSGTEGDRVTVQKGFDPSAIRVVGEVRGEPPFQGELQHPGWKVKEIKLPNVAAGQNLFVLQPAEVQVG